MRTFSAATLGGVISDLPIAPSTLRGDAVTRGTRLAWTTILWNVAEGTIALIAGGVAGSAALVAFGLDSAVESGSGVFALRRLAAEGAGAAPQAVERAERRAQRGIAVSLGVLALWVLVQAAWTLVARERPEATWVGIALPAVSILVMGFLARAKRKVAGTLRSRALEADAFQTTTCFRLSILTLAGIGLHAAFGLWWADPVAALVMISPILQEARDAWRGRPCGCIAC
jgi:divalent metal cation (Fe/Co/Zn/Cd) transporter